MLKLTNIRVDDEVIEADYIPESSDMTAHVSINRNTSEATAEKIEEFGGMYSTMAKNGLKHILENFVKSGGKELPTEKLVMWY